MQIGRARDNLERYTVASRPYRPDRPIVPNPTRRRSRAFREGLDPPRRDARSNGPPNPVREESRSDMIITRSRVLATLGMLALTTMVASQERHDSVRMGRQADGGFLVSTGQRVEGGSIAFTGRPIDLALHPSKEVLAVLNKSEVFLVQRTGSRVGRRLALSSQNGGGASAGFHGLVWAPDGNRLFASTDRGHIQVMLYRDGRLRSAGLIPIQPAGTPGNPVPGGMAITRDGRRLFVAAANRNAVVEIDLITRHRIREHPVGNLPYEPRLSDDEKTLIVTNWGGRLPRPGDRTAKSQLIDVVVDERGRRPRARSAWSTWRPARPGKSTSASTPRRSRSGAAAPTSPTP